MYIQFMIQTSSKLDIFEKKLQAEEAKVVKLLDSIAQKTNLSLDSTSIKEKSDNVKIYEVFSSVNKRQSSPRQVPSVWHNKVEKSNDAPIKTKTKRLSILDVPSIRQDDSRVLLGIMQQMNLDHDALMEQNSIELEAERERSEHLERIVRELLQRNISTQNYSILLLKTLEEEGLYDDKVVTSSSLSSSSAAMKPSVIKSISTAFQVHLNEPLTLPSSTKNFFTQQFKPLFDSAPSLRIPSLSRNSMLNKEIFCDVCQTKQFQRNKFRTQLEAIQGSPLYVVREAMDKLISSIFQILLRFEHLYFKTAQASESDITSQYSNISRSNVLLFCFSVELFDER